MKLKPWQFIGIPFGILAVVFFALAFINHDGSWAKWGVVPFIILAAAYVMSPQVNWWWYKRNPPEMNPKIQRLLEDYFAYYQKLSPELKKLFRERTTLYVLGNDFIRPVHPEDPNANANRHNVPEDLKAAVAALAVQVSFGKKAFLTGKFENIIIYPHPFPTPQYGDTAFHTSEIYEPDGVILLASDILMAGFNSPQNYFSIGLYEFGRIFKMMYPSVSYPVLNENTWWDLEKISGKSRAAIESTIGLTEVDLWGVAVYHFFTFPERFQKIMPDLYQLMTNIFNQSPINEAHPILNY